MSGTVVTKINPCILILHCVHRAAARFDGREAPRVLTSAACLARTEGHARLYLSPIRIQRSTDLPHVDPGEGPTSLGPAWYSVTGVAVLEYGPTEILPQVGALSKHAERLCRPVAKPRTSRRGRR